MNQLQDSQPTPSNPEKNQTPEDLLAEALKGKTERFKRRVLDFASKSGLSQDDPLFLVLIATGHLEAMLEEAPDTLQLLFKNWNKDLAHNLELVEQVAVERQKVAINRAANALIHESLLREGRNLINSVFPAAILFFFTLSVGFITGVLMPPWITGIIGGGYTKVQSTLLTWNELDAMKWAMSNEGKFARNLINWNRGYLDNTECVKDAQRLGVVLSQFGRKAKSGYCFVWVLPPDKRKFSP
ncbi:hypothetical protein DSM106972_067210 [Dulcicalothrix desertica PCC 7102]|uniref:Uncharacterized protein n=1 Tax=Dulcicalothrix desertica PCC 7102 TaxID=232991 RepID=A0A3S1CFD0_9CYAN|nr:DUF6753 family protein [Dulcicalothrix desertica]RUT01624.1 hypothetical protein DSM106972_067210 [Dulcicalothrix desertica PCC 7102]